MPFARKDFCLQSIHSPIFGTMAVSAQIVKELRDMTGAGMADCKKALEENNGDMNAAIDFLRKRGAASAAKRADRSTNEGIVIVSTTADGKTGSIVEINCETDFVGRNEEFISFANAFGSVVLNNSIATEADAFAVAVGDKTLGDIYNETLAKFSERIIIKRFEQLTTEGLLVAYTHVGSRLGVLLDVSAPVNTEAGMGSLRDIAMQIAAMSPRYVSRDEVDNATLAKEEEIYTEQAIQGGKPAEMAKKIAQGRISKFYSENCLLEQTFVKDNAKTVTDVLKEVSKAEGHEVTVTRFRRFALGEGGSSQE